VLHCLLPAGERKRKASLPVSQAAPIVFVLLRLFDMIAACDPPPGSCVAVFVTRRTSCRLPARLEGTGHLHSMLIEVRKSERLLISKCWCDSESMGSAADLWRVQCGRVDMLHHLFQLILRLGQ